jgi:hypothetical protein
LAFRKQIFHLPGAFNRKVFGEEDAFTFWRSQSQAILFSSMN